MPFPHLAFGWIARRIPGQTRRCEFRTIMSAGSHRSGCHHTTVYEAKKAKEVTAIFLIKSLSCVCPQIAYCLHHG
jgi:hypothetical protein